MPEQTVSDDHAVKHPFFGGQKISNRFWHFAKTVRTFSPVEDGAPIPTGIGGVAHGDPVSEKNFGANYVEEPTKFCGDFGECGTHETIPLRVMLIIPTLLL